MAGSKVLQFSALVPLGVAPLLVAATGAALVAVVAISLGSVLLSVGLMTAGVLVGGAANDLYFSVMQRWNERILNETRRGLPLRVPEPEPPAAQEPAIELPPPPVVPPPTDTPRRRLVLPGVVPTTQSQ